jgi:catechol 2,3-dioxygenase-like lactoylglutathione lyase family enzyme
MDVLFLASASAVVREPRAAQALLGGALGIGFEGGEGDYTFTERLPGVKHLGIWPLADAAEACFGSKQWPAEVPMPQASFEFEVDDVATAAAELAAQGHRLLHGPKMEPWGQTVARLLTGDGLLVAVCHTPWFHEEAAPEPGDGAVDGSIDGGADDIAGIAALAIDCADPPRLAAFWQRVLGGKVAVDVDGDAELRGPAVRLDFLKVPEPKTTKNRLHLDLRSRDFEAAIAQAVAAGATHADDLRRRPLARAPRSRGQRVLHPATVGASGAPGPTRPPTAARPSGTGASTAARIPRAGCRPRSACTRSGAASTRCRAVARRPGRCRTAPGPPG